MYNFWGAVQTYMFAAFYISIIVFIKCLCVISHFFNFIGMNKANIDNVTIVNNNHKSHLPINYEPLPSKSN